MRTIQERRGIKRTKESVFFELADDKASPHLSHYKLAARNNDRLNRALVYRPGWR